VAGHGIAINVLSPGWVDTEMTAEIKPELRTRIVSAIPTKRMGTAEEIAEFAVAILAQSNFLTGEILSMAGGG
jgi:3-oxoacyl-[acyl-carrier protein] reductase